LIFLDIDGVLNVAVKDPGHNPPTFNATNLAHAMNLCHAGPTSAQGRRSLIAEKLLIMHDTHRDTDGMTYGQLISRSDQDVSDVLVRRFAQIVAAAGPRGKVVLCSSWRKPKHVQRVRELEALVSQYLGCTFAFHDRTAIDGEDNCGAQRLVLIGDYVEKYCSANRPSQVRVMVLEDFLISKVTGWLCGKTEVNSVSDAERYLESRALAHVSGDEHPSSAPTVNAEVIHTYQEWVAPECAYHSKPMQMIVGVGLGVEHVSRALGFLGNSIAKEADTDVVNMVLTPEKATPVAAVLKCAGSRTKIVVGMRSPSKPINRSSSRSGRPSYSMFACLALILTTFPGLVRREEAYVPAPRAVERTDPNCATGCSVDLQGRPADVAMAATGQTGNQRRQSPRNIRGQKTIRKFEADSAPEADLTEADLIGLKQLVLQKPTGKSQVPLVATAPTSAVVDAANATTGCPYTKLQQMQLSASESIGSLSSESILSVLGAFGFAGFLQIHGGNVMSSLAEHQASWGEDAFLASVVGITLYCLYEMTMTTMKCPHVEARIHTTANVLATFCSLYGVFLERVYRESPDLWWAVLTPVLYIVSNFTMTRLMKMYKGPIAYTRLFELGQSFTLSFQGIHLLAWSSVYPVFYWLAMPFWYYSLKKFIEPVAHVYGVVTQDEKAGVVESHRERDQTFGAFGLELDGFSIAFMAVNIAAALIDNAFMGVFTLRGPDGFWEVSRSLVDSADGVSDHLRMALVKPALGSLVISMSVFLGTLVSRKKMPLWVGVPMSALLSSVGPWLVFFWHGFVDPSEPWMPEFMGTSWGPGPLGELLGMR